MGQKGEAVLFLLPFEMEYLDLLGQAGVKIRELGLEQVHTALPQPDGVSQPELSSKLSALVVAGHSCGVQEHMPND